MRSSLDKKEAAFAEAIQIFKHTGNLTDAECVELAEYEIRTGTPDKLMRTQLRRFELRIKLEYPDRAQEFRLRYSELGEAILQTDNPTNEQLKQVCELVYRFVSGAVFYTSDGRTGTYSSRNVNFEQSFLGLHLK
jgi:hypothetical protein